MLIDDIDTEIVRILARDGRTSGRRLAALIHISEGTARLRLRRLLESTVKVKALVAPGKVGFPISAILGLRTNLVRLDEVVEQLVMHPRVNYLVQVTGMFDILALCMFRSTQDLFTVLQDIIERFPAVKDIQTNICLETPLGHFATITPGSLSTNVTPGHGLDKSDLWLIGRLVENGRLGARQLSAAGSISEVSVRRHLKRLLDNRVVTVRAVVSPEKIGFPAVIICGLKVDLSKVRNVTAKLASHDHINFVTSCAGVFDVFFTGMFRSNHELSIVLQEFVAQIDGVRETQTFICIQGEQGYFSRFVPRCIAEPSARYSNGRE